MEPGTPVVVEDVEVQLELSDDHRPSLGRLVADYRLGSAHG